MKEHDMTGSWDMGCCPLVHAGARSNQGLVRPGNNPIRPGDTFHLSFGAKKNGYATDFQRTWYVFEPGEKTIPQEVQHAFDTVRDVIEYVRVHMRPGMEGRQVDAMAPGDHGQKWLHLWPRQRTCGGTRASRWLLPALPGFRGVG